jgi:hypothetical protein
VQLLRPESIERMETPESLPAAQLGPFAGYGLFNYATCYGSFVFHGHNGAVNGGLTEMAYLPEYGRGYAIMINSGKQRTLEKITILVRHQITRDLTPPKPPTVKSISVDVAQHYAGYYQNISPRKQKLQGLMRLVLVQKLDFNTNGFYTTTFGVDREHWLAVTDKLFRKSNQTAATFALLPDEDGQTFIQNPVGTYKKVSGFRVWGQLAAGIMLLMVIASRGVHPLVRLALKLFGESYDTGPRSIRRLPVLSILLLGIFFGLFLVSKGDMWSLGKPTWISIGILLVSIAFPITTVASLYALYRGRTAAKNRLFYWHSVLVTLAVAVIAAYMGYWGFIGLCLWA